MLPIDSVGQPSLVFGTYDFQSGAIAAQDVTGGVDLESTVIEVPRGSATVSFVITVDDLAADSDVTFQVFGGNEPAGLVLLADSEHAAAPAAETISEIVLVKSVFKYLKLVVQSAEDGTVLCVAGAGSGSLESVNLVEVITPA